MYIHTYIYLLSVWIPSTPTHYHRIHPTLGGIRFLIFVWLFFFNVNSGSEHPGGWEEGIFYKYYWRKKS